MKRNTIYRTLLLLFVSTTILTGCDISELPYTSVTDEELASNPGSVQAVTLGNYSQLKELKFNKGVHQMGEYGSDNLCMSGSSTSGTFNIYNYQRTTTNSYPTDLWGISYKLIVNCNNVISITKEGQSDEMDHLIGENYFMRGLLYHQLAIVFGKSYHVASDTDLAVPLKLSTDRNDYPPRATVKKVYEQVVLDLKKAETLMQTSKVEKNACYANTWAAKAMLSRVYLYMHAYTEAEAYATDVIEHSKKKLLTSNQYPTMNEMIPENNPEAIFAIRMVKDIDLNNLGAYSMIGSQYAVIQGQGYGEVYASLPLWQAFQKYPNDVRASFIKPQFEDLDKDGNQRYEICFIGENFFYDVKDADPKPKRDPLKRQYFRYQAVTPVADGSWNVVLNDKGDSFEFAEPKVQIRPDGKGIVKARQLYRSKAGEVYRAEWVEYEVKVDKMMKKRNDYPRFYITKCSYQEQQSHLWSPMILRLSEMYMNRAESRYYLNNPDGAVSDMNEIKRRAMIPLYSEENDGELLDAILDERRKEFFVEAQRKYDLLRNNKVIDRHYPGYHDRGAETVVVQEIRATDPCAVFYIPQREIDAYPIPLEQNP